MVRKKVVVKKTSPVPAVVVEKPEPPAKRMRRPTADGFGKPYEVPDLAGVREARAARERKEPGWTLMMLKALGLADPPDPRPPPGTPCVGCYAGRYAISWMVMGLIDAMDDPSVAWFPLPAVIIAPSQAERLDAAHERAGYESGGRLGSLVYYRNSAERAGAERRAAGLPPPVAKGVTLASTRRGFLRSLLLSRFEAPANEAGDPMRWGLARLRSDPRVRVCAFLAVVYNARSDWLGWLAGKTDRVGHQLFVTLRRGPEASVVAEVYDPNGEQWLTDAVTAAVAAELSALSADTWWRWFFGGDLKFTVAPSPSMPGLQVYEAGSAETRSRRAKENRMEPGGYCSVWSTMALLLTVGAGDRVSQVEIRRDILAALGLPDPGAGEITHELSEGLRRLARTVSLNMATLVRERGDPSPELCAVLYCCLDTVKKAGVFSREKTVQYSMCGHK
jgi:hypothetical protein